MPRGDMPSCRRRFFAVPAARARACRRARRACPGLPRLVCRGLPGRAFRHYRQFHRRAYHEKTASGRGNIRMKIETQSEKMRIYLQKGEYLVQTCSVPGGMRACGRWVCPAVAAGGPTINCLGAGKEGKSKPNQREYILRMARNIHYLFVCLFVCLLKLGHHSILADLP